jgi:hypothetical protein
MQFAVFCVDKPDHQHVRQANRPAHVEFLKAMMDQLVIAGPTLTEDGSGMTGSLIVAEFPDRASVEAHFATDPYAQAGLFQSVTIIPFKKVLP